MERRNGRSSTVLKVPPSCVVPILEQRCLQAVKRHIGALGRGERKSASGASQSWGGRAGRGRWRLFGHESPISHYSGRRSRGRVGCQLESVQLGEDGAQARAQQGIKHKMTGGELVDMRGRRRFLSGQGRRVGTCSGILRKRVEVVRKSRPFASRCESCVPFTASHKDPLGFPFPSTELLSVASSLGGRSCWDSRRSDFPPDRSFPLQVQAIGASEQTSSHGNYVIFYLPRFLAEKVHSPASRLKSSRDSDGRVATTLMHHSSTTATSWPLDLFVNLPTQFFLELDMVDGEVCAMSARGSRRFAEQRGSHPGKGTRARVVGSLRRVGE